MTLTTLDILQLPSLRLLPFLLPAAWWAVLMRLPSPAGHIVYFGEREGVMSFFNSMGFQLPARKGIADFLQEVTSRKDQGVRRSLPPPMHLQCSMLVVNVSDGA